MSEAEYEEIAEAEERPVVVERVTVVEGPSSTGEMLRFFALLIVLGVVVLGVAVTRPFIFGKIVPAVMGEGIAAPTTEVPLVEEVEEGEQAEEEGEGATAVDAEPGTEETTESTDTPVTESDTEEAAEADDDAVVDTETAVSQTTHRVRQGETLQAIAAQYSVTMQALIEANQLTNPDLIKIGDELVIPQAEE